MTDSKSSCPDAVVLSELVEGVLDARVERDLLAHLDDCHDCQQRLETCVAPDFSPDLAHHLSHVEKVPAALRELIRDAEADIREFNGHEVTDRSLEHEETSQDVSVIDTSRGPESRRDDYGDVLGFIEPADDGGAIGKIGAYQLTHFLGRGGMGLVFKGQDEKLNRSVAIKIMSPTVLSHAESRIRFNREARAVAAVSHPGIVTIHAVDDEGPLPWFVMEYVDGPTLEELLQRRGRLSESETIRLGYQLAQALAAAHEKGIIHRDIKPANVLIQRSTRRARLTDFGLASMNGDAALTTTGVLVGTPSYLSPEAINASSPIDERSDLFSLGCLLYRCVSGRLPFESTTTFGTLQEIVNVESAPLSEILPHISPDFDRIVNRLLQKSPGDRPASASLLATEFKALATRLKSNKGEIAESSEVTLTPSRTVRRRFYALAERIPGRWRLTSLVALITTMVALLVSALWPSSPSQPPGDRRSSQMTTNAVESDGNDSAPPPGDNLDLARRQDELDAKVDSTFGIVVLDGDHPLGTFRSLDVAIDAAPSGSTVEIRSNGPFQVGPIDVDDRSLTITAKPGTAPRLIYQSDSDDEPMFCVDGEVVLKGLSLETDGRDGEGVLVGGGQTLQAENCRFITGGHSTAVLVDDFESCRLVNCEFYSGAGVAIRCESSTDGVLKCDNCLFAGMRPLIVEVTEHDTSISLDHCTLIGEACVEWVVYDGDEEGEPIRFSASHCVFAPYEAALRVRSEEVVSQSQFARVGTWRGQSNVWRESEHLIDVLIESDDDVDTSPLAESADDIHRLTNVFESNSAIEDIQFNVAWDRLIDLIEESGTLTRNDCELERSFDLESTQPGVRYRRLGPGAGFQFISGSE